MQLKGKNTTALTYQDGLWFYENYNGTTRSLRFFNDLGYCPIKAKMNFFWGLAANQTQSMQ